MTIIYSDVEAAAISVLSRHPDMLEDVNPDLFTQERVSVVNAMVEVYRAKQTVEARLVSAKASVDPYVIAGLYATDGVDDSYSEYIEQLELAARKRNLLDTIAAVRDASSDDELSQLMTYMNAVNDVYDSRKSSSSSIGDLIAENEQRELKLLDIDENKRFVNTGWKDLDALTGGISVTSFVAFGGRPGMGKSRVLLSVLLKQALEGKRVVLFNLEMSMGQVINILVSYMDAELLPNSLKKLEHRTNDGLKARYDAATAVLSKLDLHIFGASHSHIDKIVSTVQRLKPDIFAVDYLQLAIADATTRIDEVSQVSRQLRALALTLVNICFVTVQLSRSVEGRASQRPLLSDARDSGQIEQDVTHFFGLYRHDYYYPESPDNILEVAILKAREGNTGTARLYWHPVRAMAANLAMEVVEL